MALKWFKKKQAEKVESSEALTEKPPLTVDDGLTGESPAGTKKDIGVPGTSDAPDAADAPDAMDQTRVGIGEKAALPTREMETGEDADVIGTDGSQRQKGFFKRLKKGLTKTREFLNTDIEDLFRGGRKLDEAMLEDLEELLITSDIGVQTTMDIIERISKKPYQIKDAADLKTLLKEEISAIIDTFAPRPKRPRRDPMSSWSSVSTVWEKPQPSVSLPHDMPSLERKC